MAYNNDEPGDAGANYSSRSPADWLGGKVLDFGLTITTNLVPLIFKLWTDHIVDQAPLAASDRTQYAAFLVWFIFQFIAFFISATLIGGWTGWQLHRRGVVNFLTEARGVRAQVRTGLIATAILGIVCMLVGFILHDLTLKDNWPIYSEHLHTTLAQPAWVLVIVICILLGFLCHFFTLRAVCPVHLREMVPDPLSWIWLRRR